MGDDGRPRQLPWEDWRPGDDEHTSGWMRATAPAGSPVYEDRALWSGELGYGVREPEGGQPLEDADRLKATARASVHGQHGESGVEAAHGSHGGSGGHSAAEYDEAPASGHGEAGH
ncbi:MAG: hypothetical protein NVSMB4_12930 [Acidimicrobiales bacterium]